MSQRLVTLTDEDIELLNTAFERCPDLYSLTMKVRTKLLKAQSRITHHSAKGKGRDLQQWVCRKISVLINIPYDQQDDNCDIHSREMSQAGVDVILRGEARKRFPLDIECKAVTTLDLPDAVKQADVNAGDGRIGAVVFRQTNFEPVVIFSWTSFERLYRNYFQLGF